MTPPRVQKPIPLMRIVPEVPGNEMRLDRLRANLTKMGCGALMDVPWGIRNESFVSGILYPEKGILDTTIRGNPESWRVDHLRATYGFQWVEYKIMEKKPEFLEGEFNTAANPKDGFQVGDLI